MPISQISASASEANLAENMGLLRAIGWVQNTDFHFNYGENPLNEIQVSNLNRLVTILADAGYRGTMIVDINFGNPCMEPGEGNSWRIARNDLPVTQCKMLRDLNPKFSVAEYLTGPYQNFEKSSPPLKDGRMSIRVTTSGLSSPHVDYPIIRASTTAGEWNNIALRNNRISIQFAN
jgi:hypothetical protein